MRPPARRGKRGLRGRARAELEARFQAEITTEVTRLTCLLAGQLAGQVADDSGTRDGAGDGQGDGAGLAAVETAIRAGMLAVGASLLGRLLAADSGHRGPRIDCGAGHQGEFVAYRAKTIATVLGPVVLRRAWYHCAVCGHGTAPRDQELGVAGTRLTPGLRAMIDRAGAAVPFAPASRLLADLAGVEVNTKTVQRTGEADGQATQKAILARAAAINQRALVPLPPSPLPDIGYVAIDGTGVPMTRGETEGRPARTAPPRTGRRQTARRRAGPHP